MGHIGDYESFGKIRARFWKEVSVEGYADSDSKFPDLDPSDTIAQVTRFIPPWLDHDGN